MDQLHVHVEIKKDLQTIKVIKTILGCANKLKISYCMTVQVGDVNLLFSNFVIFEFLVQKTGY